MKDIQVYIDTTPECQTRLDAAFQLSKALNGAFVKGLYPKPQAEAVLFATTHGAAGYIPEEIVEEQKKRITETAGELQRDFLVYLEQSGCPGEWRESNGVPLDVMAYHGRFSDLTVVSQLDEGFAEGFDFAGTLVMESALPVLAVPAEGLKKPILDHILIAWNGSAEASHAVKAALPLLQKAGKVTLLTVGELPRRLISQNDIAAYLGHNGVDATPVTLPEGKAEKLIPEQADTLEVSLIVAGAWGHNRLREMIFGGATASLFANQKTPVFMCH
ncbi:universal stress protein [Kiloniella sp. b19]|uniref:universal stress protein n=1 Tax=Kiloniella sp. GXU_MW_B19 TaxID=3141326 RepID=UPI0031DD845A